MDSIFGFMGDGFVVLAADSSSIRSILAYKHDEDKIRSVDSHKLIAAAGPQADCVSFIEYIQRNIALNEFRTNLKASTQAIASYTRNEIATALRKNPYQVNMLLGGYDKDVGASMYYIDYMGASNKMNYGAHGYASYFLFSTLDRHWKPNMNQDECLNLVRMCIKELATRFIIHQPNFKVKIADKDGIREVTV